MALLVKRSFGLNSENKQVRPRRKGFGVQRNHIMEPISKITIQNNDRLLDLAKNVYILQKNKIVSFYASMTTEWQLLSQA